MNDENYWFFMRLGFISLILTILPVAAFFALVQAQAPPCHWRRIDTGFIQQCVQTTQATATATPKPEREQSNDPGYPAPGDPTSTQVLPYPPPISGDPNETPIPTRTDRPTPTLAPTMTVAP